MELNFKNLLVVYDKEKILDDITFKVEKGTIHAIIGPNGAGKSTLVKSILSLVDFEGSISMKYEGEKIIGYVPQKMEFDRNIPITVKDFLTMIYQEKPCFLKTDKKVKKIIEDILLEIGLIDKKDRLIGDLSGGERQRVLLAQALHPKPNLLILDEPFTGIDTVGENFFLKRMKELKEDGTTIIWIEHNLKQIIGIADSVTCIKKQLCFSGRPEEHLKDHKILDIFV